jgi:hypothetical protein
MIRTHIVVFQAFILLMPLTLFAVEIDGNSKDAPHQFVDLKTYSGWNEDAQAIYAAGMSDAFSYLSAKNGRHQWLDKCLSGNKATARVVGKLIRTAVDGWKDTRPNTPVLIAQLYEVSNKMACSGYLDQDDE